MVENSEMGDSDGDDYGGTGEGRGGGRRGEHSLPSDRSDEVDAKTPLTFPSSDSSNPLDEEDPNRFKTSKVNKT